jgi:hypothetical protein
MRGSAPAPAHVQIGQYRVVPAMCWWKAANVSAMLADRRLGLSCGALEDDRE